MYTSFYKLKSKPFQISSDPSFIWLGEKHREALATLRYGVLDNKGFLLLTGDVGTGKTTLINTLIASLEEDVIYASVPDPRLETLDFFNYIATSFGIHGEFDTKGKFLIKFSSFLHEAYKNNKKVLLIIDESQLLSQDALEEIRLLSNIVLPNSQLLNIFFIGQNEFHEIITRPENRAVAQRLTLNYYIEPLSLEETGKYIQHRLEVAGTTEKIFDKDATREIHAYSKGFPRRINIICDHCLLTGFVKEQQTIDSSIVRDCSKELEIPKYKHKETPTLRPDRMEQPVAHPPVRPMQPAIQPPAETQKSRPFMLISTCLLLAFAVVIVSLIFPGFLAKTYNDAIDYFSLVKNRHGMIASAPTGDNKTDIQVETGSFDYKNKTTLLPPPAPPIPTVKNKPAETEIPITTILSGNPKGQDLENPAIIDKPDAESQLSENPEGRSLTHSETIVTELEPETVDQKENIPQPVAIPLPTETLVVRFVHNSNFFNSQDISELRKFAETLRTHPEASVQITGYTDSSGNKRYNTKLSEFRAEIAKSFLLGLGLPAKQIQAQGLGINNPIDRNDTEEGRSRNRRVEIKAIPKQ